MLGNIARIVGLMCALVAVCAGTAPSSGLGGGQGPLTIAELGVLSGVLSQLETALSQAITQADTAMANRINQAEIAIKVAKKQIDEVISHGENAVARQREDAARQAFAAIGAARELVDETGKEIFTHVNETLAAVSATVDAIPFVRVPDTVFAVSPYRIRTDSRDREVSIFGYFPSLSGKKVVTVTMDGTQVKFNRGPGKIFFDLSDQALSSPRTMLDIAIQFPTIHGHTPVPIHARLHKLKAIPYTFSVQAYKQNAAKCQTVVGGLFDQYADHDENPSYSAEQFFNLTVPADVRAKFNPASAQFADVSVKDRQRNKPCGSCPDPDGIVKTWDASSVLLQMKAPSCPYKVFDCGGGGSNFHLKFVATFNVCLKDAQDSVSAFTKKVNAGWKSVTPIDLPKNWTKAVVRLKYDDNFDASEQLLTATVVVPTAAGTLFDLREESGKLYISAH